MTVEEAISEGDRARVAALQDEANIAGRELALKARKSLREEIAERLPGTTSYNKKARINTAAERQLFIDGMMKAFGGELRLDEEQFHVFPAER